MKCSIKIIHLKLLLVFLIEIICNRLAYSDQIWQQSTYGLGSGNRHALAISPNFINDKLVLSGIYLGYL